MPTKESWNYLADEKGVGVAASGRLAATSAASIAPARSSKPGPSDSTVVISQLTGRSGWTDVDGSISVGSAIGGCEGKLANAARNSASESRRKKPGGHRTGNPGIFQLLIVVRSAAMWLFFCFYVFLSAYSMTVAFSSFTSTCR